MRFGFHLPQFGRAIATGGIERAAVQAEELGYNDVWVSDHLDRSGRSGLPGSIPV